VANTAAILCFTHTNRGKADNNTKKKTKKRGKNHGKRQKSARTRRRRAGVAENRGRNLCDGLAEGIKAAGKETVAEFLARLLAEHKEYKEKKKLQFDEAAEKIQIAAYILSQACEWNGARIACAFCEALTDSNFHKEREALAPEINKLFGTDIAKEG